MTAPRSGNSSQPGRLRIRVLRGVNLAIRDKYKHSSDPYVVIEMGKQKVKTTIKRKNVNPEWNEDLTLPNPITDFNVPIKLTVYDNDMIKDDKMGDVQFDIKSYREATEKNLNYSKDVCLKLENVECGEVVIQLQWIHLSSS